MNRMWSGRSLKPMVELASRDPRYESRSQTASENNRKRFACRSRGAFHAGERSRAAPLTVTLTLHSTVLTGKGKTVLREKPLTFSPLSKLRQGHYRSKLDERSVRDRNKAQLRFFIQRSAVPFWTLHFCNAEHRVTLETVAFQTQRIASNRKGNSAIEDQNPLFH